MRCRNCGFDDTKVLESRESRDGTTVRRRRECLQCGFRMTTFERYEELPIYVLKRSGLRETFNIDKLRKSLDLAFRKRNVDPEQIELIASQVEERLRSSGVRELATAQVGETVLELLREVDPVAYVRFASVYRAFGSAEDFVDELKTLEMAIAKKTVKRPPPQSRLPEGVDKANLEV